MHHTCRYNHRRECKTETAVAIGMTVMSAVVASQELIAANNRPGTCARMCRRWLRGIGATDAESLYRS